MSTEPSTEALLNELIDLLIYINDDTERWKTLIATPIANEYDTQGHLGLIVSEGYKAKVSLELAQAVVARYAESESVSLSRDKVISQVASSYEIEQKQEEYNRLQRAQGNM